MTSYWLATHPIAEPGTALRPGASTQIAVVGAGLTGLVTALLLARAGRRVALLEARTVGAVASGHTTAKVSLLQGGLLSQIRRQHAAEVLTGYVEANRAGQRWLAAFLGARGLPFEHRTAWTYAQTAAGGGRLEEECEAAIAAGLPVAWDDDTGLPFAVAGAIRLDDQVQIHPTVVLDALLAAFLDAGGVLHTGCRVQGITVRGRVRLSTSAGDVMADRVVLATGAPIADRGGHFAALQPQRSYALAARVAGPLPTGMYLSIDQPTRSLRTVPIPEGEALIVGGDGHLVGRARDARERGRRLTAWTHRWFPSSEVTHHWSAQDYAPAAGLPVVGVLPWSRGRLLVATGYHKWGMTNAVASALRLEAHLNDEPPPDWGVVLDEVTGTAGWSGIARITASAFAQAARGWLDAEFRSLPEQAPSEGCGVVGRRGLRPTGTATVEGHTHTVSAVCTHLGGVLTWNDSERSWDCPLHGSRFDAEGRVLEGPATTDLARLE